jgi:hypothetical protein
MDLTVANAPSQDLAFTNCVYVTQSTLSTLGGDKELYGEIKGLIYTLKPHDGMQANCIGLNSIQRRILSVSAGETLTVAVFPQRDATPLSAATIEVNYVVASKHRPGQTIDGKELSRLILQRYSRQYVTTGQQLATECQGVNLLLTIGGLEAVGDVKGDAGGSGGVVKRGVFRCAPFTRSSVSTTSIGDSMAVPQTSPSPCAAWVSPTLNRAPATSTGR